MGIHQGGISDTTVDPGRLLRVGDIIMSGNSLGVARGGFLLCDGSAVSRALYSDLFTEIGVTFGPGDGVTTFNIPDFRSRSPIGVGQGTGLSSYVMGQTAGEENHILTVAELATHTHLQNSHNHTQDAHTHTQDAHTHTVTDPGHNHTQNSHNHTQDAHTHTQDAHLHSITDPGHTHPYNSSLSSTGAATYPLGAGPNNTYPHTTGTSSTGITATLNQTATNQNTTATNQATTATNISNTTGVTNQNTTATNQNTTATNQATTAVNQNEGGGGGHNTIHPVLTVVFMIKF